MDLQKKYDPSYYGGVITRFFPWAPKIWASWVLRSISKNEGIEPKILDVGCGPGQVTLSVAANCRSLGINPKIIGVDMLDSAVDLASERKRDLLVDSEVQFHLGNATALPFHDNEFDLVMASMLFPFLDELELTTFFNEVYRVLKPKGRFHFVHPNRCRLNWLVALIIVRNRRDYELSFVEHSYTPKEICELVNQSRLSRSNKRFNLRWFGLVGEVYGYEVAKQ
jgi:ubiquinone/menaquinone biosynthesis C-methylase UbiE